MEKLVLNVSGAAANGFQKKLLKKLGPDQGRARRELCKQGITIWPSGDGVTFEGKALEMIKDRARKAGCTPGQMFSRIIASWVVSSDEKMPLK